MKTTQTQALRDLGRIKEQYGGLPICCGCFIDGYPGDGFLQPPDPPECCGKHEEDIGLLVDSIASELRLLQAENEALKAQVTEEPELPEAVATYIGESPYGSLVQLQEDIRRQTKLYTSDQMHNYAAAQWGAEQAQQTTEPELPEPEWIKTGEVDRFGDSIYVEAYTATQMQAHYQAGVRAGMGQSQDARRYRLLREQQWQDNKLGVVLRPKDNTVLGCFIPSKKLLDGAIDRYMSGKNDAMKGDKQ